MYYQDRSARIGIVTCSCDWWHNLMNLTDVLNRRKESFVDSFIFFFEGNLKTQQVNILYTHQLCWTSAHIFYFMPKFGKCWKEFVDGNFHQNYDSFLSKNMVGAQQNHWITCDWRLTSVYIKWPCFCLWITSAWSSRSATHLQS